MAQYVQRELEIILIRRWASYVSVPIFMLSPEGDLLYYNDAAGKLLGSSYDESGPMSALELGDIFATATVEGKTMPSEELPIVRALTGRKPTHGPIRFTGLDGVERRVDVTGIPLLGLGDRFLGVLAVFWETEPE